MRRIERALVILATSSLCGLGGCGLAPVGGMAERCADFMKRADPGADIDITGSGAAATGITTIVAHAEGVRRDVPTNAAVRRHLAVQCRFDGDILTGFKWTKGPT